MVVALHGHSLTHLLLSCQFNSSDGAFEAELADTFEAQVVPEEYFVCRELWPLPAADEAPALIFVQALRDAELVAPTTPVQAPPTTEVQSPSDSAPSPDYVPFDPSLVAHQAQPPPTEPAQQWGKARKGDALDATGAFVTVDPNTRCSVPQCTLDPGHAGPHLIPNDPLEESERAKRLKVTSAARDALRRETRDAGRRPVLASMVGQRAPNGYTAHHVGRSPLTDSDYVGVLDDFVADPIGLVERGRAESMLDTLQRCAAVESVIELSGSTFPIAPHCEDMSIGAGDGSMLVALSAEGNFHAVGDDGPYDEPKNEREYLASPHRLEWRSSKEIKMDEYQSG